MGYGLGRSPFFVMFTRMFNKWGQNAVTPIYTHIPQYPEITGYFFIPSYNRMVPLLTIGRNGHAKICRVHACVPSSGAPFFCEGVTNKKTHFSRARSLLLHGPETTHDHPQTKTNMYLPKNLIDI